MSALALGAACFMLGAILSGWIVARTVLQAIHNRDLETRQDKARSPLTPIQTSEKTSNA